MDVKTTFLNRNLLEYVCMTQPEGFAHPTNPGRYAVLLILRILGRYASFKYPFMDQSKYLGVGIFILTNQSKSFDSLKNKYEPYVYKKISVTTISFLGPYVDEILLIGNYTRPYKMSSRLRICDSMKDLGEATYILGIKIYSGRFKRLIKINQSAYIDKVLKMFGIKRGNLPLSHIIYLSKDQYRMTNDEGERMSNIAMVCTRLDVCHALSMTNIYQFDPSECQWTTIKNILKYLRRTENAFLVYEGLEDELVIKGYKDASFQTDNDELKSQPGYVFV